MKCSCRNISTTLSTRAEITRTTSTDGTLSFPSLPFPSLPFLAPFLCSHRPPKPHQFDVWPGDSAVHTVEYFNVSARMRVLRRQPHLCAKPRSVNPLCGRRSRLSRSCLCSSLSRTVAHAHTRRSRKQRRSRTPRMCSGHSKTRAGDCCPQALARYDCPCDASSFQSGESIS
jgi:hypothetical protein